MKNERALIGNVALTNVNARVHYCLYGNAASRYKQRQGRVSGEFLVVPNIAEMIHRIWRDEFHWHAMQCLLNERDRRERRLWEIIRRKNVRGDMRKVERPVSEHLNDLYRSSNDAIHSLTPLSHLRFEGPDGFYVVRDIIRESFDRRTS